MHDLFLVMLAGLHVIIMNALQHVYIVLVMVDIKLTLTVNIRSINGSKGGMGYSFLRLGMVTYTISRKIGKKRKL